MADTTSIRMEGDSVNVTVKDLQCLIKVKGIFVHGFFEHSKASEKSIIVSFSSPFDKKWYIPYFYRRTELFIDDAESLAKYVESVQSLLTPIAIAQFKNEFLKKLYGIFGTGSTVTVPIFKMLLANCGEWICNKEFDSSNTQRRIQDIKERGFTLATKIEGSSTYHMILPFPQKDPSEYETFSPEVRKAIFRIHHGINAFTGERASLSCLPDHKFPEIRWNHATPVSNEHLSPEEMLAKFQIIPEKINQMKREVCRKCFQSGIRGKLNGIEFYYEGDENWDTSIPTTGKESELGCVGCFWYDMLAWRKSLHATLKRK